MNKETSKSCVGLFGTCGNSTWREKFIKEYEFNSVNYFNPQKDDWQPEDAIIEAEHLANDNLILFPVLSETYGLGSLAETGFSILQAISMNNQRELVVLVDELPDESLKEDEVLYKESVRGRKLVKSHMKKLNLPNVYLVPTLEEMLQVSLILYRGLENREWFCKKYSTTEL